MHTITSLRTGDHSCCLLEPSPRHRRGLFFSTVSFWGLDLVLGCSVHPPSPCSSILCVLGILELPPPGTLVLTEDHCSHEEAHHHPQEPEESL